MIFYDFLMNHEQVKYKCCENYVQMNIGLLRVVFIEF